MEKKLNLKQGMKARVLGERANVNLAGVGTTSSAKAVRQVAIDDVWSALRFRPRK